MRLTFQGFVHNKLYIAAAMGIRFPPMAYFLSDDLVPPWSENYQFHQCSKRKANQPAIIMIALFDQLEILIMTMMTMRMTMTMAMAITMKMTMTMVMAVMRLSSHWPWQ